MSIRSFRMELKLNKTQELLCAKCAGTSRFAYNWKLGELKEKYEAAKLEADSLGKKPSCKFGTAIDWHKEWVLLKGEKPWIREVSKCCGQEALRDLHVAYQRFFTKKAGYPKFKKRGLKDSFRLTGTIKVWSNQIQLPTIGKIRLKETGYAVREGMLAVSQATVSRQADRWLVSFVVEDGEQDLPLANLSTIQESDIVGLDLGVKELGITSEGEIFQNPKAYSKHLRRLKRYQRKVSRKQKGSNNRKKASFKLSRLHMRISNIRSDFAHKMTTCLAKAKSKMLVIESLRPKNMSKNHNLAGSILDAAFGKIKTFLKYKCKRNGKWLVQAPTFYASSKYCSCCGHKYKELQISEREWTCRACGTHHDRDVNAGKNLQFFGEWLLDLVGSASTLPTRSLGTAEPTGSFSPESDACRDERLQFLIEQCSSVKQEFKSAFLGMPSFA